MVLNNESITIMQKVEELKQWHKQYEARQEQNQTLDSPISGKQGEQSMDRDLLKFSSPSIQPRAPENVHILDLDNGIHMIDELLNRIQRQSTEAPHSATTSPSHPYPQPEPGHCDTNSGNREDASVKTRFQGSFQKSSANERDIHQNTPTEADFQEILAEPLGAQESHDDPPNSGAKPRRQFLKRGQGLTRYRMTLSDFNKPVPKPSFAMGRKKPATRPVAVPNKQASTSVQQQKRSSRPELLSKAALNHLETWSNVFGEHAPREDGTGRAGSVQPLGRKSVPPLNSNNVQPLGQKNVPPLNSNNVQPLGTKNVQMSPLTQIRSQMATELDRRKKIESEEQKVFDLLEQKTRDSSFNSTSSMVARLMEDSVMSTPVKVISSPDSGNADGRIDKGSQVRFTETIEEVDETTNEDKSLNGFTIDRLPNHSEPDCECDSDSDTQYCSSDEEAPATPCVEEAIRSYKPVLNRPYVDSGKTGAVSYSQLEEYLKLSQPLRPLPLNPLPSAPVVQTSNNAVVKETKQLLADIKKLAEERQRQESETEDKENEREKRTESERWKSRKQGKRGASFPMTVYQEAYQKHTRGAHTANKRGEGLKSFGSEDPEPNPFEQKSESELNLEVLKKRLGDLENEIHVFRLENIKLNKERKELEKDKAAFTRTKKSSEKSLEEEKAAFMREMEEERSKLNKEKKVFLKYAKDAKNFPSKQEREELSKLKAELLSLKEEAVKKETKWAASQARLRNHIKVLETQNQELKVQVEKLGKEAKKVSFASKKHISNTQIMNAINSQISKLTKSDVLPPSILKKPSVQPTAQPNSPIQTERPKHCSVQKEAPSSYNLATTPTDQEILMPEDSFDRVIYQSLYSGDKVDSGDKRRESGDSEETPSRDTSVIPIESLDLGPSTAEYKEIITADGTKEKHYTDGRQEIHYPNGNTVIISEAGKYIKMFYYNGDIKETDTADQTERYFYSETNTWHTTQADGTEVLEFSNGQRETRHKDGLVEIEYSNGCRRTISKDGSELWRFDSGPVETVETLQDGTRTLRLRNGQREIHTRDYKRREFPDGSVKLVYPDGIQETRYPNGRIRLKDGDGNLIMDSHEM